MLDLHKVIRSAPDIAIEVLSPSTGSRDRGRKMEMYARYGVKEYWLVDPIARSIERFELIGDRYTLAQTALTAGTCGSSLLPGFEADIAPLFT